MTSEFGAATQLEKIDMLDFADLVAINKFEKRGADDAVRDANGNVLLDGDSVVVIKDLPVKGAPKPVKAGTKVKNIRLVDGDHNIACKIDGFGAMGLKSEFVRKA